VEEAAAWLVVVVTGTDALLVLLLAPTDEMTFEVVFGGSGLDPPLGRIVTLLFWS
jgi:hypothetical protein